MAMIECLRYLAAARTWCSGQALADELGISRAAVHKQVHAAIDAGWQIETSQGRGYRALFHDVLDAERIAAAVGALATVEVLTETESTNDWVLRTPFGGTRAVLAEQQLAGRGRRGRRWHSPPGENLYLTIDWQFASLAGPVSALGPAIAVSAARAVSAVEPQCDLAIKWPNDLYAPSGRKVGGILIDAVGEPAGPMRVAVGIGLNVHMHQAELDQPWAALSALASAPLNRNVLAAALIRSVSADLEQFATQGLTPFLPAYKSRDWLRDKPLSVLESGQTVSAEQAEIQRDGSLSVMQAGQRRNLYAADVSVRA